MTATETSPRRLLDTLEYLVDERVGIIQFVVETPREPGGPNFFHSFAQAANTSAFCGQANFNRTGGASADRDVAIAKAVGEAVERYCGAIYDASELPLHTYAAAPFQCVHPSQFALLSAEQYQDPGVFLVPFTEQTSVRWGPAVDPLDGRIWYVPAAMIYIPYIYDRANGDSPVAQPISTGLACHCSAAEAATNAVCEVIERDAFTITWQAMLAHPQIEIESLSDRSRDLVARFGRSGYEVTLLDMTMDTGVATVLAVSRSHAADAPPFVPAAAASLDPEEAVRKSLEELEHTREYSQQILRHQPRLADDPSGRNVTDQIGHLNYWCDPVHAPQADFLFHSTARRSVGEMANLATGDIESDLRVLLQRVNAVGHRALLCDLTTPDIAHIGLAVVRAIIPGFHPLVVGHAIRSLGGARLRTVPARLGVAGAAPPHADNPAPHPYP